MFFYFIFLLLLPVCSCDEGANIYFGYFRWFYYLHWIPEPEQTIFWQKCTKKKLESSSLLQPWMCKSVCVSRKAKFLTLRPFYKYITGVSWHPFVDHQITQARNKMSLFFFRLHNLQREEANKKKKRDQAKQRQRRGAKVFKTVDCNSSFSHLTLAPSRLFEKTPMNPSDSLDEIALQIPR